MADSVVKTRARTGGPRILPRVTEQAARWRYSGGKRDLRLDLLRGFAVITMVIDHVGGKESWLYTISGGDRFFVSAAEGFVFISGLVMGIVYASLIARQGVRAAFVKGTRRVMTLYSLTVLLSVVFAVISFQLDLPWASGMTASGFPDFVTGVLTMHRGYYLTDVLLLYTLVVAAAIPLLALMSRVRHSAWLVLGGSWALWAAWQWWPADLQIPWAMTNGTVFNFSSWQVLFITGLVLGYNRNALGRVAGRIFKTPVQWALLVLTGGLVTGSIALYLWGVATHMTSLFGLSIPDLFGKNDLRLGRLAVFACLFIFAFLLTTLAWTPIKRLFGWFLLPLGQDALLAYTSHLFAVAVLLQAAPTVLGQANGTVLGNTLTQAAGLVIIWLVVRLKVPVKARVAAIWSKPRGWAVSRLSHPFRGLHTKPVVGRIAGAPAVQKLGALKPLRPPMITLCLVVVALASAGPGLARALKNHPARFTAVPEQVASPVAAQSASVASTTQSQSQSESEPDFTMLVGATAVAVPGPVYTPTPMPSYVQPRTFQSTTLNRTMPYYIYLPPSYDSNPTERFPVLYMLHGISGSNNEWSNYGLISRANELMKAGQISQFIIVLPQGDQSFWLDHADGGPAWGTYVVRDVVNEIDTHYRTVADAQHRAIGGLSMGGYGALELAISYPDVFSIVGAHSPTLHKFNEVPSYFGDEAYFDAHDPVHLYAAHADVARTLKIWVDDGEEDAWISRIDTFHEMLLANGIGHEWHAYPGEHSGEYWSTHVLDYLGFYSAALSGSYQPTPVPTSPVTATPTGTATAVPTATALPIGAVSPDRHP